MASQFSIGRAEPEQEFYDPEASLHKDVICSKNPGHKEFIPIYSITVSDFPEGFRDRWRVKYAQALGDLTVHVRVRNASKDRPKFYPGTGYPFPFHTPGGGVRARTGSAYVRRVFKCGCGGKAVNGQTCDCFDCLASPNPKKTWWKLEMTTALRVIYDDSEATDADVTFFFDNKDSKTVVKKGHDVIHTDIDGDLCLFTVILHEADVGERLMKARDYYRSNKDRASLDDPVMIVSHPHGLAKHVTLGKRVKEEKLSSQGSCLVYTTSTCPGSSGGPVVGAWSWGPGRFWYRGCPHSAALLDGTNRSGLAWLV